MKSMVPRGLKSAKAASIAGAALLAATSFSGFAATANASLHSGGTAYTTDYLNERSSPSMGNNIKQVIPYHGRVNILGGPYGPGWYKVNYDGTVGYVWKGYLSPSSARRADGQTATTAYLNQRSGPGLNHGVMRVIPYHGRVSVLSGPINGGWYKVSYGGTTGYVWGYYLTETSSSVARPSPKTYHASSNTSASSNNESSARDVQSTRSTRSGGTTMSVSATAYNGAEPGGGGSLMRDGNHVHWGAVAVDPDVIPLGSQMYISGYGNQVFTAEDTGGAIDGHDIDIWMPLSQAYKFGRQQRTVTIIRWGWNG